MTTKKQTPKQAKAAKAREAKFRQDVALRRSQNLMKRAKYSGKLVMSSITVTVYTNNKRQMEKWQKVADVYEAADAPLKDLEEKAKIAKNAAHHAKVSGNSRYEELAKAYEQAKVAVREQFELRRAANLAASAMSQEMMYIDRIHKGRRPGRTYDSILRSFTENVKIGKNYGDHVVTKDTALVIKVLTELNQGYGEQTEINAGQYITLHLTPGAGTVNRQAKRLYDLNPEDIAFIKARTDVETVTKR